MATPPAPVTYDVPAVQRRTLRVLFGSQVVGGVGVTIGVTVGALLAEDIGGTGVAGLAGSSAVVGAALLAVPVTRLMQRHGRRPGLSLAYLIGAVGALVVVGAALVRSAPLLFAGMALFGGGSAANLQARYSAADLAEPARRARQLSFVIWGTTLGAVSAPNLAGLADRALGGLALPEYTGPFVVSAVVFTGAALLLGGLLRPDPLLLARRLADPGGAVAAAPAGRRGATSPDGLRAALTTVAGLPRARLALATVAVGHLVMVAVMTMTPVYIGATHTDHVVVLRIVGFVLSAHIAGMYALSPLVGWLADRLGRRRVILLALGVLVAACAVAGTADHHTPRLTAGLAMLGLGWSGTMVSGSTLLAEAVPVARRPLVQGLSDLAMGLVGAAAGALSGVVVQLLGYPVLALLAALTTVPVAALALRVPARDTPARTPVAAEREVAGAAD